MKRALLSVLAVLGVLAALAAVPATPAGASGSFCGLGFPAANTFVWTGAAHDHLWQTPGNWKVNGVTPTQPPGGNPYRPPSTLDASGRDADYACIGASATVIIGGTDAAGEKISAEISIGTLDLGQNATLTATNNSNLWLNRPANTNQPSTVRTGSTLSLQGSSLGGQGTLSISGTLKATSLRSDPQHTFPVAITTRFCDVGAGCSGAATTPGRLLVAASGLLLVDGVPSGSAIGIAIEDRRFVDNFGTIRLVEKGYIAADHGTTIKNEASGTIDIANDYGVYEGRNRYNSANAKLNNYGALTKSAGTGNSVIGVTYQGFGGSTVTVASGTLTIGSSTQSAGVSTPQASVSPGGTFGLGSCTGTSTTTSGNACSAPSVSSTSPQAATVTISPASSTAQVTVSTQTTGLPTGTLGQAVQFLTPNATPTPSQPNVFTLVYDASLTPGRHASELMMQRAEDTAGAPFATIPNCPSSGPSCVDRAASHDFNGGIVMVIRTTQNSRWIAR